MAHPRLERGRPGRLTTGVRVDWRRMLPIDAVARQVGLANAVSLRPHVHRLVGVSPQQYRDTFRTPAGV